VRLHGLSAFALPLAADLTAARSQMAFTLGFHIILAPALLVFVRQREPRVRAGLHQAKPCGMLTDEPPWVSGLHILIVGSSRAGRFGA
jgi:hypothetical protein